MPDHEESKPEGTCRTCERAHLSVRESEACRTCIRTSSATDKFPNFVQSSEVQPYE